MSERTDAGEVEDPQAPVATAGDGEEIDALPVLAHEARAVQERRVAGALSGDWRSPGAMIPAVQAAAVAAGGFVAGAAVVGLVHRRRRHSAVLGRGRRATPEIARRGRRSAAAGELLQIVGSRSLLVDVHLLGGSGADG
jgi:hypothetical protein